GGSSGAQRHRQDACGSGDRERPRGDRGAAARMSFGERYAQTGAQIQAYVAGLPVWVNVWRGWMFLVFTLAVVFAVRSREARWLGVTMIVSLFAYNVASMAFGVGRFPSIAFLVFWTPLAIYLARRRPALARDSVLDRVY